MIGRSSINPKGFGNPIAVLYTSSGIPIALRTHNYQGFNNQEGYFHITKLDLTDSEEDGVECDIDLESSNIELINHPNIFSGSRVKIAFGYIIKASLKFGPPYHLVIQDYKANFDQKITFSLKLVDSQTFSTIDKDNNQLQPIDELNAELNKVTELEESIKTPADLKRIFEELNKARLNFDFRRNLSYFKVPTFPGSDNALTFYDINELRDYLKTNERWKRSLDNRKIDNISDNELVKTFRATHHQYGLMGLALQLRLFKSPLKDLYGYSITPYPNDQENQQWINHLSGLGLLSILEKLALDSGKSAINIVEDKELLDKAFEVLMDKLALKFVESDINLSVKANLEKLLNETQGGPYNVTDTGDGSGTRIINRDLDKRPFMGLTWKGGTGDLLKANFETDFFASPSSMSMGATVNPETGDVTTSTEVSVNHQNGMMLPQSQISSFVDQALSNIEHNRESEEKVDIGLDALLNQPHRTLVNLGGSTSRAGGLSRNEHWAEAIDNTAVYLKPAVLDLYLCKPGTIKQVQDEIDNRKKDRNLKQVKGTATILGRPDIKSGMVFLINGVGKKFNGNYYALSVKHSIDSNGYLVTLDLGKIATEVTKGRLVETDTNAGMDDQKVSYRLNKKGIVQMKKGNEDWSFLFRWLPLVDQAEEGEWYHSNGLLYNDEGQFNWDVVRGYTRRDPIKEMMEESGMDPSKAPNQPLDSLIKEKPITIERSPNE